MAFCYLHEASKHLQTKKTKQINITHPSLVKGTILPLPNDQDPLKRLHPLQTHPQVKNIMWADEGGAGEKGVLSSYGLLPSDACHILPSLGAKVRLKVVARAVQSLPLLRNTLVLLD